MMAFVNNQSIALATNHTLSINPNVVEERTKDDGDAPVGDIDGYTWGITSDSVVGSSSGVEQTYQSLITMMLGKSKVGIVTDAATPATGAVPTTGWKESSNASDYPESRGEAYIESITITAGSSGSATMSVSFKGQGELS